MGRLEFLNKTREVLNQLGTEYTIKDKNCVIEFHIYTHSKQTKINETAFNRIQSINSDFEWSQDYFENYGIILTNTHYNVQIIIHTL